MYDQIDFDNEEESQQLEFDPVNDHCQYAKNPRNFYLVTIFTKKINLVLIKHDK